MNQILSGANLLLPQARLLRMVGQVLQNFVPRPWGAAGSGGGYGIVSGGGGSSGVAGGKVGLGIGFSGMNAGGLNSPPVNGVVGGLEGLSLLCESPRVTGRSSLGGGGGGSGAGGGGLMWSAEGGRQLETWRVRGYYLFLLFVSIRFVHFFALFVYFFYLVICSWRRGCDTIV